jgi:thiol-disulfide isomerase/thioredoxin
MGNLTGNDVIRWLVSAILLAGLGCDKPATERVTNPSPPVIESTAQGRVVHNPGAPERYVPRAGVPARATFLFSGALAAAIDSAGRQAVLPPAGDRLLIFDRAGRFLRSAGDGSLARGIAVTSTRDGWLVVERDGNVVVVADSQPVTVSVLSASLSSTADDRRSIGLVTFTRLGDAFIAARSPFASVVEPETPATPLLLKLDQAGKVIATLDTARRLADPMLTNVANAGHLAANDSLAFLAFLTRDEIRAYDRGGKLRWTADRAMTWPRPPTGGARGGTNLSFQPVNLSIATRDGIVYVLAFADSASRTMRVDAFDAGTGILRRSGTLPAASMLISLDDEGALWYAPADTLAVIGAPPGTVVANFDLPTPRGDTLHLRSLRGKVVLLNVWASWCDPCREEFPLLAQLSRELAHDDFAVVAVSDDIDEGAARRFLAEYDPPFSIVWGRGSLQRQLNYRGLPFTALLDRDGRVIKRYIGFGGERQFDELRADVLRAIRSR